MKIKNVALATKINKWVTKITNLNKTKTDIKLFINIKKKH